jgi:hypothetical protein
MSNTTPTIHFNADEEDAFFSNLQEITSNNDNQNLTEINNANTFVEDLKDYKGNDDFITFLQNKQSVLQSNVKEEGGSFNLKEFNQNPVKKDSSESIVDKMIGNSSKEEVQDISEEAYAVAFDFIKENNLLFVPEGVELNGDTLPEILQYDQQRRAEQAFDYIKSLAGDEHVADLLQLVINGGTFKELEVGKDIITDEIYFKNINLDDETERRALLTTYLKEGLDPKIPNHAEMLEEIPSRVDAIEGSYKGKERALKAQEYFLNQIEEAKRELERSKIERIKEEEAIKLAKYKNEVNWRNQFFATLKDSNWTNQKQNEVVSHFNTVKLIDGTELPLWDYKLKKIWENPKHAQTLFRFLSDFDEYKLEFKNLDKNPMQLATNKILEMAQRKSVTKTITNHSKNEGKPFSRENLGEFINQAGS